MSTLTIKDLYAEVDGKEIVGNIIPKPTDKKAEVSVDVTVGTMV